MMRADVKRLNENGQRVWLDRGNDRVINIDRAWEASDRQNGLSRRAQALLAAAGESGPDMRWYVLRIANHAEKDVDKSLSAVGIECWIPTEKRVRNAPHAKRKLVREVPALPGYVFVKVADREATWAGVFSVDGVVSVLGGACGPVPVSHANLLEFKKKLEEKATDKDAVEAAFPVGATVLVEEGPFALHHGTIDQVRDDLRAIVLVPIFGRFVPVELELAQITKSD